MSAAAEFAEVPEFLVPELPSSPYPGLRPFEKREWPIFFGRERMTDEVIDRLLQQQFLIVHGSSGSGKSSLISAGVHAQLEQSLLGLGLRSRTCICRPGDRPLANLAEALSGTGPAPGEENRIEFRRALNRGREAPEAIVPLLHLASVDRVCILLDQFEELFRFARNARRDEASLMADFVVSFTKHPPANLYLLITMRSDFLGECAEYEGLAEAVNQSQYLLRRMETADLLRAIREPALLYGGAVAEALAERLIRDAREGRDELPLVQHGLARLWRLCGAESNDQKRRTLELADYERHGPLARLLSDHANQVFDEAAADADGKRIVAELFRALTDINADGNAVRRPQRFGNLVAVCGTSNERLLRIVDKFRGTNESFLTPYLPTPVGEDTVVDVGHEALIRGWDCIAAKSTGWLQREFRDGLSWRVLLGQAESFAGDGSSFLSEPATTLREGWLRERNAAWASRYGGGWEEVRKLVQASRARWRKQAEDEIELKKAELAAKRAIEERKERDRKFRQLVIVVGALVVTVTALVIAIFVVVEYNRVSKQARLQAERNQSIAFTASAATEAPKHPVNAAKLVLAAWPRDKDDPAPKLPATLDLLGEVVPYLRERVRIPLAGTIAVFSPNGRVIVTAPDDKTARIWDAADGHEIAKFDGHLKGVTFAAFSPEGKYVVTASKDKTARIWDAANGREVEPPMMHDDVVYSANFSPDGNRIVTASEDNSARVWNAVTGARIAILEGHGDSVTLAAFSPDGRRVVTASNDLTARIWDAEDGRAILKLEGHLKGVTSAAFSPDGTRIVTASNDMTARVWDAADGHEIAELKGHLKGVTSAAFSPDGHQVITASADKTARIWDATSGRTIATLAGHDGQVTSAAFSFDGKWAVTASIDNTARIWDAIDGREIARLNGHDGSVFSAAFNADATRVVTVSNDDSTTRVWDATFGRSIRRFEGHDGSVRSAAFSSDGMRVVTASADRTARIWDAISGRQIVELSGHDGPVHFAAFSPDGMRVVTASADNTARIWDANSGRQIAKLSGHNGPVNSAAFSPDGRWIVTASSDGTARIWDGASGDTVATLVGDGGSLRSASFSPDGTRIVTASDNNTTQLWDTAFRETIARLIGHEGPVSSATFSFDGRRVITASWDGTARIWDVASGLTIHILRGREHAALSSAAFSADGTRVVTAAADGTARIWDAASVREIATLVGHGDAVTSIAFSADDKRVVTASADKTARTWDVSSIPKGDILEIACACLPDKKLEKLLSDFSLTIEKPICGSEPPAPDRAEIDAPQ